MVLFHFRGDYGDTPKNSPVVDISKDALDAVPQSLLAVISQKRWQRDEKDDSDPITVDIYHAPCQEEWNPEFAEWIRTIYEEHKHEKPRLTGVPDNVELEDAWAVLDYFGLTPEDPRSIDMSKSRKIVRIRAGLFLRYIDDVDLAVESILDNLISKPHKDQYYVFASSSHDYRYIKENNYRGPIPVMRIMGSPPDSDMYFECVQNPTMRKRFVSLLEDEGLEARFLHDLEFSTVLAKYVKDYTFEDTASDYVNCFKCGKAGHYQVDCPASNPKYKVKYSFIAEDMCWVVTKEFEPGTSQWFEPMYVVHTKVPLKSRSDDD